MPTLIVEDGSGVVSANTYLSEADVRTLADSMGVALPADSGALQTTLLASMAYLESQSLIYQGHRASATQYLEWPRNLVKIGDYSLPNNKIPLLLKKAQVAAMVLIANGTELVPTVSGQFITREKVGPIETEYSDQYLATPDGQSKFKTIDVWLAPLKIPVSGYRLSEAFGF